MRRTAIIGIGNPDRGDDAVGRIVAARLRDRVGGGISVVEVDGEATDLIERIGDSDHAILVDAALSGGTAGEIHRFDVTREPLPAARFGMSTHGFGLGEAIELARALGRLPARCVVFAVEARSFDHGAPLSPAVAAAADMVIERVLAETAD